VAANNEGTVNLVSDAAARHANSLYREYDGVWYAPRAMGPVVLLASAARTTSPTIAKRNNYQFRGLLVVVYTSAASSPSTVWTTLGYDPDSTASWTLIAGAAITGTGTNTYQNALGSTVTANVSANLPLPPVWFATSVHGNANSHTYSAVGHYLV
jgi:hypothetical protein